MSKHLVQTTAETYVGNCYPPESAYAGAVHYDTGTQGLKVYDGSMWHDIDFSQIVTLTPESERAIDQMIELTNRPRLDELAAKYPLVAEALGQLEVALKLCQNNEPESSTEK